LAQHPHVQFRDGKVGVVRGGDIAAREVDDERVVKVCGRFDGAVEV
jgi:hypothetical protein